MQQQLPLAQLVTTMRNGTTTDQNDDGRGVPVTRIETISDGTIDLRKVRYADIGPKDIERWKLLPGDILLSHINSVDHIGKAALYNGQPEILIHGMNLMLLRPDQRRIRPTFLHYALRCESVRRHIRARCKRAINQASINQKELGSIEIVVPALGEQQKAVDLLSRAENIVRMRREAEQKAKEIIPALFLDMFGDPESPKVACRMVPLSELVVSGDQINYGVVQPGSDVETGVPLVRVGDLKGGRVDKTTLKRIDPSIEMAYQRSRLRGDEILISCVGSIGNIAISDASIKGFNIARAVARVPLGPDVNRRFIAAYLRTAFAQRFFAGEARTVSQPTLNIKQIKETPVLLPSRHFQESFSKIANRVDDLEISAARATKTAESAFQSLLAGVFGEAA